MRRKLLGGLVFATLLIIVASLFNFGDQPVCTTYVVSSVTGEVVAFENYTGPPPHLLNYVSDWWTENCD